MIMALKSYKQCAPPNGNPHHRRGALFRHKITISPSKFCHMSCSHSPRPTRIPCGNYILAHAPMKHDALYSNKACGHYLVPLFTRTRTVHWKSN